MITDDQARLLLARAAETIEVGDRPDDARAAAARPARHPSWLVPAAVVIAVVLVIGAALTLGRVGPDAGPAPADRRTGEPVEQPYVAGPGELPGLIGYTAEEARDELTDRGLRVVEQPVRTSCEPDGIVTSSTPGQAAAVEPGDTITLRVTESARVTDCAGEPPWGAIYGLVRFARGLGDDPPVEDTVRLTIDGRHDVTLTAEEATDPDAWTICSEHGACHSALAALEQMLTRPSLLNGQPSTPSLVVEQGIGQGSVCPSSDYVGLWVGLDYDGPRPSCGPVSQVSLVSSPTDVRDVVAVDLTTAPTRSGTGGLTRAQQDAAEQFVAWARDASEDPPPFADRVRILDADDPAREVSRAEAVARDGFELCSEGTTSCYLSALALLRQYSGPLAYSAIPATLCGGAERDLPEALEAAAAENLVRIDQPEPGSCAEAFAVELTFDDAGDISAVNALPPTG